MPQDCDDAHIAGCNHNGSQEYRHQGWRYGWKHAAREQFPGQYQRGIAEPLDNQQDHCKARSWTPRRNANAMQGTDKAQSIERQIERDVADREHHGSPAVADARAEQSRLFRRTPYALGNLVRCHSLNLPRSSTRCADRLLNRLPRPAKTGTYLCDLVAPAPSGCLSLQYDAIRVRTYSVNCLLKQIVGAKKHRVQAKLGRAGREP